VERSLPHHLELKTKETGIEKPGTADDTFENLKFIKKTQGILKGV